MAVEVSRPTQQHLDRIRPANGEPEWWLPLALVFCLFVVVVCAATALAL
jgi:hypothetical protein